MIGMKSVDYSVSTYRPTKSLSILALFKEFNVSSIEIVEGDSVKCYDIPLPITAVLDRFRAGSHSVNKLSDTLYSVRCFDRYDFTVVYSGDSKTMVLL